MVTIMRSASIAPGKLGDALAFAHNIAKFIHEKYGIKLELLMPIGGNPNRIGWHTMYASLADLETTMAKLMADPEYMALIAANAANMIAGSVYDDIWRVL